MTLNQIRFLIELGRTLHFGKAAEACHVSQPALSLAIKKLEEELGVVLVERLRNDLRLTEIGTRIIARGQAILEAVSDIEKIARHGNDPLAAPLRLGVIFTIGPYLLPDLMPVLSAQAPHMPLVIEEDYTLPLLDHLRRGTLDVALFGREINEPGLECLPLYDEPFVVAVPNTHPWKDRASVALEELHEQDLVILRKGHCFRDQVLKYWPRAEEGDPGLLQHTLEGSSLETIRHMVASGAGITVLPCSVAYSTLMRRCLIHYLPFDGPAPSRRVCMLWRPSFPRPQVIEVLRQAVRELPVDCLHRLDETDP